MEGYTRRAALMVRGRIPESSPRLQVLAVANRSINVMLCAWLTECVERPVRRPELPVRWPASHRCRLFIRLRVATGSQTRRNKKISIVAERHWGMRQKLRVGRRRHNKRVIRRCGVHERQAFGGCGMENRMGPATGKQNGTVGVAVTMFWQKAGRVGAAVACQAPAFRWSAPCRMMGVPWSNLGR